jgi:hypothetical protein
MLEVKYQTDIPSEISEETKRAVVKLLIKQNKVRDPSIEKLNRCKWLCLCKVNGIIVSIGAIKPATTSDFDKEHSNLPHLKSNFRFELGYCYTEPDHRGKGYSSSIVRKLIEMESVVNLIASTEIRKDNRMVHILEKNNFARQGEQWKSGIHGRALGLYVRKMT